VLPAAVAVLGGLMLIGAGPRPGGKLGALLALAAGVWFAIGPQVSLLWNASGAQGAAHGSTGVRVLEMLTYHTLLGSLMAALAGYALPGLITRKRQAAHEPEAAAAEPTAAPIATAEPRREPVSRQPQTTGAPAGAAAATDGAHTRTAITDREATPDGATHDETAPPARNGASADEQLDTANAQNGDTRSAPGSGPPRTHATTAPITMRRRRGGLLSILRR
jgi:hypothetical protein